ncbi:6-carboxytetrahydropterin synthase QueD [Thermodesulfatator autotrophicus]|uniref:6-carboxy-5,6,7,8-tetrahydropterin synthase n=1 Tax=Thermodesulfatator autotrophicus TaxID=1795632 RepID=A0A177E8I4_9BACT|nr:6-carboxytetrahydropterin synthase QueD [Thermodesulfatator autotrophicus]OAG28264.1 6-pyruvoyl tetrahydrobiopterin synthase [Thermodesulfatator autotrophicus]
MFELTVRDEFAAAHYLRNYPGACERLHGHNWKVEIAVRGEKLNEIDVLVDFKNLKKHLKEVLEELDHQNLNEHPAFQDQNPSSENIARYIFEKLAPKMASYGVELVRVTVCETERSCASYLKD